MKVRIRKKYPEGGNLSAYPHPKSFLNPVQRDYHIFQPQRSYTPGQNASSGKTSNEITDDIIMAMLPLPPVAKGIQAGVKGYRALKAAGKAEEIAAEIAAKQEAKTIATKIITSGTENVDSPNKIIKALEIGKKIFSKKSLNNLKTYVKGKNVNTGMSGEKFIKDWHESPEILRRLDEYERKNLDIHFDKSLKNKPFSKSDFNYNAYKPERRYIPNTLNQFKDKSYRNLLVDDFQKFLKYYDNSEGLSLGYPDKIYSKRVSLNNVLNPLNREHTIAHELSHLSDGNGMYLGPAEREDLLKPFGVTESSKEELFKNMSNKDIKDFKYYTDPTEIRARINQGRFYFNHNPENEFTQRMTDRLISNGFFGMGKYIKDPKAMKDLMNNMWQTAPIAGSAYVLQKDTHKHGGKIKKRNYTPSNMEAFHQANDAHVTSGPFLQRNGMSFPTGGTIAPYITKDPNDPRIEAYRDSSRAALFSYRETEKSKKNLRAEINTMDSLLENRLNPLEKATLSGLQATRGRFSYKPEYSQYFIPAKEIKEDLKKGKASKMGAAYIAGKAAIKGEGYGDAMFIGDRQYAQNAPTGYNVIGDDRYVNSQRIDKKTKEDLVKDWTIPEKYREYLKTLSRPNSYCVYPSVKGFLNYETGKKYFENPDYGIYDVIPKFEFPKQQVILQKDQVPAQTLVKELHTTQAINNQVKKQKKIVSEQVQTPQEMPKDTVRVPSTLPTKKLVQTKYMDARPYYQEEQMKDYDKTGKLDSAKIDAHKRWLKEQGDPNRDTNLLPVKHPYGGTISSLGQAQGVQQIEDPTKPSAVQQGIGSFGPWGAAISAVSQIGTKIAGNSAIGQAFTSGVLDPSRALGALNDKRFNTGEKLLSLAVPFTYGLMKAKKDKRTQAHNDLLTNTEGFQDSGFMANGGLLNIDPQGRVVTSRYDQGGNIRRIQGGVMHDEGYGIEHAYGASHEQGGMDYAPNAEIQGNEKVLDGEYVITDEPGSELDKTQMSISRRLDKNTKALSTRNNGDQMKLATDKLKNHAIQQNEEYLTARNNERDSKLRNAIRRAIKKYGGDLETLDAEMDQMRRGGAITSRGSKWILGDGTGSKKLSDYGADPSVFAADYMSGNAYNAQRAGLDPSSSVAYSGAPMANYGQKMFANNDAYSGYRGYDGLPGYGSMAATPPNVNLNNTGTTYGRWESDRNSTPPPTNRTGNWANTAMDLAPVIANTVAGLSKADKVKASKYYTKYMTPDLMQKDFEPIRRGIAGSQYGLRNSGMYSRAGQASIAAQGAKAMGDYSFNVDQANTGIKNQFKGLNSQIETGNRGIDWQSDMFNFQAKDARRNYLMQAAGDLSKYSQNKQNYNRDQEFLEMAYPEYARIMRSKRGR